MTEEANGDRLVAIFNQQRKLMHTYEEIEAQNGLLETRSVPVDLNDRFGQARLKGFAWRFTEELAEAASTNEQLGPFHAQTQEEIIDALHFLIELLILAGLGPQFLVDALYRRRRQKDLLQETFGDMLDCWYLVTRPDPREVLPRFDAHRLQMFAVIQDLGSAMHCLKQRPWKRERLPTNVDQFSAALVRTFGSFGTLLQVMGLTTLDVHRLYFSKAKVNEKRQQGTY